MNPYLQVWKELEAKSPPPLCFRNTVSISFKELAQKVRGENPQFVRSLVESLYAGDIFLIKEAFTHTFIKNMIKGVRQYWKSKPSEFYKMLENTPDFHRQIDAEIAKKYSVYAIKHSTYFFPWNEDPLNLFATVWDRWSIIKYLIGLNYDEYVENTPKDGVVDRIQVCLYPAGIGRLEQHRDPLVNQRTFISGFLSTRGEDYQEGGFFAVDQNHKEYNFEPHIAKGDMAIGYATIAHGVHLIDPKTKDQNIDHWNQGRWFLGLYSNDSDEKKVRAQGTHLGTAQMQHPNL